MNSKPKSRVLESISTKLKIELVNWWANVSQEREFPSRHTIFFNAQ
jgi:hypothetical protein